jgi:NAD(P)-dependent dehydrogenase (short-subunit alcohol dehydrogenase family)
VSRIALVTGASRGLGHAVASRLGGAGWQVVAVARTVGGLEELDDAIRRAGGPPATLVPLDLADRDGIARLAAAVMTRFGGLDLLIHCAVHAVPLSPVAHVAPKEFDRAMAINAGATLALIAACEPLLRARPGSEALFCDDPAAGKFHAAHAASKAAARAIVAAWAGEMAAIGPRVSLFVPLPMPTASRSRFHPGEAPGALTPPALAAERLLATLARDWRAPAPAG